MRPPFPSISTHRGHPRRPAALVALAGALVLAPLPAQAFPVKPIRLIVPFPPGGSNDIIARTVGQRMAELSGQQVVVDNRGGAGGLVGAVTAATAAPDGYTLLLASLGNLVVNPALQAKPAYDGVRDFAPITLLASSVFILVVHPGLPAQSVKELVALAKAKPDALNYGSAGVGSSLHLTAELFKLASGTRITHVAYKGTGPALTDLIGGQVQMVFSTIAAPLPHVKAGRLRALGTSGLARARATPEVPTIAEAGLPGFEVLNWQGLVAPAKTPPAVLAALNQLANRAMKTPVVAESLSVQGLEPAAGAAEPFARLIAAETKKYAAAIKAAAIRAE